MCLFFTITKFQPISLLWLRDSEVRMAVALRISLSMKSNFAKISKEINILSESPWTRFWYFWQQHVLFKFALKMLNTDNALITCIWECWRRPTMRKGECTWRSCRAKSYKPWDMNIIINSTKFWHFPGVKTDKFENYFTVKVTMKADFGDKLKSI